MGTSPIPLARAAPVALLAVVAGLAGCGGGGGTPDTAATTAGGGAKGGDAIVIQNFAYRPADISVPAGTTVAIANRDGTPHTVTAKGGGFDSGSIASGGHAELTLDHAGEYTYYCSFHPFMKGTIEVE